MSKIQTNFENKLNEVKIPFNKTEIESGHSLYRFSFRLSTERALIVEVIIQNTQDKYADAQIIYRHVHLLTDRSKESDAYELLNELNEMKTGYYSLFLAGDGEIFLRTLLRTGEDAEPLYQTLVMGSGIAKGLQDELTNVLGESGKTN
ncbi:hypothetical protein ACF3NG_06025 [Aerococcaceae bacterium WGS1372]